MKTNSLIRFLTALFAFSLLAVCIGCGTRLAGDDVAAAQSIIRAQVDAFGRDDAATAYSYAAPAIQSIFPQADIFLSMV